MESLCITVKTATVSNKNFLTWPFIERSRAITPLKVSKYTFVLKSVGLTAPALCKCLTEQLTRKSAGSKMLNKRIFI